MIDIRIHVLDVCILGRADVRRRRPYESSYIYGTIIRAPPEIVMVRTYFSSASVCGEKSLDFGTVF